MPEVARGVRRGEDGGCDRAQRARGAVAGDVFDRTEFGTKFGAIPHFRPTPMHAARDVKPITYLKSSTAEAVREVSEEGRTLLITQNGEAKAVLMDVATYDRWRGAMALLKMLSLSELDVRGGRLLATDEALQRFDRALNAADR